MASSRDYWRDREADWAIEYANNQAQWDAKISEIYTDLQNRMVEEINNWYMRFADKHGLTLDQARHLVSIADQDYYANRAKYFVGLAGQDMQSHSTSNAHIYFSDAANKEMSLYNTTMRISRMEVLQSMLNIHIASAVGQTQQAMGTCLSQHAMQVLLDRAKILGPTVMNNMSRIPALVNASFHGATFSSRLWNTHQQNLQKGIQSALARGLILGEHPERFRREIVKESQLKTRAAFKAARTLLNTEFCRVQTSAEIMAYKTEGFKEYMYIANERCCPECQDLDGQIFKVKGESAGSNLPPMHPNCRCSTAPYSDRKEYEKWLDGYADHGLTWEEWDARNEAFNEENWIAVPDEFRSGVEMLKSADILQIRSGLVTAEEGYNPSKHKEEIEFADWLSAKFHCDIVLQKERKGEGIEWPDYLINDQYWELKTVFTDNVKRMDGSVKKAWHQVRSAAEKGFNSAGGIIVDVSNTSGDREEKVFNGIRRFDRINAPYEIKLVIVDQGKIIGAYRKKQTSQ